MLEKREADVIIIGGGIMGCATAYRLAKQGVDVLVLEKKEIGNGGSCRNAGGVRQSARDPKELPLAMYAVANIWPHLSEELGVDVEYHQGGNLRLGLTEKALLMGATNDVGKALKTADLFVLSSDYEGMPNALMEAMAAGIPCIATDCPCGGPKELFGEAGAAKLVPCGDAERMKQAICAAFEEPDQGEVERSCAEKFYPDRVNAVWKEYIAQMIQQ